jgi:hypothetical protein
LDAIFHHPVPHNVSWMDTLHLLIHLESAEEKADGKYSLTIRGRHLIFHKPHGKHLDAREITELRHYLASAGVSPHDTAFLANREDNNFIQPARSSAR